MLLTSASNQQISVLPIVGMAGLGKTTLTKIVYNHALIRKHFDVLAWVRVTKSFNVERILSEILKSLGGHLIGQNMETQQFKNFKINCGGKNIFLYLMMFGMKIMMNGIF
jgi:chromosomal replication initiation ATPase DnaA